MAFINLTRIFNSDSLRVSLGLARASKLIRIQSASICSKENRDPNIKKPEPWPYEKKGFHFLWGYIEGTLKRFDENTKVIVVDGNIGAGKTSLAKQLAEAFDMVYFPEPTLESLYLTSYGYDLRKIDELLPPSFKCCDINTYYSNPHHQNVPKFQFRMYVLRLEQYIDALAHVLNTGQGVILDRSVYGDFVFAETMHKFGYLSSRALKLYYDINENTLNELMRPHLVIYLDISPEVALQRIKERNNPVEVNSKVLTKDYLATMEYFYKHHYLKKMEKHAEILIYDWNKYGDVEVVVEDIERIDFDKYTEYDNQMCDWRKWDDWEWNEARRWYTNEKGRIMGYTYIYRPSVKEVFHPGEECVEFKEILYKIPGEKYAEGYNPMAGDNVWFKTKPFKSYRHLPFYRVMQ